MSMRKWQEVQEVSRRYSLALLITASIQAAVLPTQFGDYKLVAKGSVDIADRPVWDEYGFKSAERADYESAGRKVNVSVWQLTDSTGAFAAAQWLQPGVVQHGNYVVRVEGELASADLQQLRDKLPDLDRAASPVLPGFLPAGDRLKNSERYILGPVSLSKFEPRLSAELAGFHKGAEAQLARYRVEGGEAQFLLFSYPTPQIAGERFREFQRRQDLRAERHGPMVAVVLDAPAPAAAKLASSVSYQPKLTWSEKVPKNENPGEMILAICILAGALIVASVVLGLVFGGLRQVFGTKFGVQAIDDNFTSLHIDR